ncbi:MAG: hypothetical protein V1754_10055, partial [Pseudomonadota bacterium]
ASGVSAGATLQFPVKRLDVVELEPSILEASVYFEGVNNRPLADPRIRVFTDDGRNFLAAGKELYDVIINEPSNPWITGVSNLFTKEYFEIGKKRLHHDGVFCTWAQMYEISPRRVKAIYRSFLEVFPYSYAFSADTLSSDTFLIGTNKPLKLDLDRLRHVFSIASVQREMERAKIQTPHDLVALTFLGPGEMAAYTIGAEKNTDDNALVEFGAPRDMYNDKDFLYYVSRIYGHEWLYGRLVDFLSSYRSSEDFAELTYSLLLQGKLREAKFFKERVQPASGPHSLLAVHLLNLLSPQPEGEEASLVESGSFLAPPKLIAANITKEQTEKIVKDYFLVEKRTISQDHRGALDLIENWPESAREEAGEDFHFLWGYLAYKCGEYAAAKNILKPLWEKPDFRKKRPAVLFFMGHIFYENADYKESIQSLEQWIEYRKNTGRSVVPKAKNQLDAFKCSSCNDISS